MKVIQIVPAIFQDADGVSTVVKNLCESMLATGTDLRLAALDWTPMSVIPTYQKNFPLGLGARRLGRSPLMHRWLRTEVESGAVDIIHNHGLWMMPNVYAGNVCQNSNCQLMFSPHGTMTSWALARSALLKNVFWKLFQGSAVQAAACFHATAESEYAEIRKLGFKQPICILPCGVNVMPLQEKQDGGRRQLLYLARVHPIKGVDILLNAWQAVEYKFSDWDLIVAGPDNGGYLAEMQALAVKLKLQRVVFRGPLFGDAKWKAYRDASLYVLPTHSENFGITVAEALAAGTPVIATHGAPWAGLAEHGAGWWIEIGVAPLVECLEKALSTSPQVLNMMGQVGNNWMKRDFSWERISAQFLVAYRWLIDGGEPPPWIRLD
jgi:glycosyltransferase involved in cell wall biosynthesis